mmetsp:Transcript_14660/g.7168  ORF Transcript_14660/g.7168 Transcript_14660/m.7168 type:complete len:144 (-) Transcript_14660:273-704(-)
MVETWIEVLPKDVARNKPMSKIQRPEAELFEMRLVIWEVKDIPFPPEETASDLYVRVNWDPEGWNGEPMSDETDVHCGSEDGYGVYNFRMKFNVKLPLQFPRLKLEVFDFNTFSDDVLLATVIMDWSRYFKRLLQEGKIEIPA